MSIDKKQVINGKGKDHVTLAVGARVQIRSTGDIAVVVNNGVVYSPHNFVLPWSEDTFQIIAGEDTLWSVFWFVPKPGVETPDPTPVAIPANGTIPEPLEMTIARLVRAQVRAAAQADGFDTEDEDDYEEDEEEDDRPTKYEYEERGRRAAKEAEDRKVLERYMREKIAKQRAKRSAGRSAVDGAAPPSPAEPTAPQVPPKAGTAGSA